MKFSFSVQAKVIVIALWSMLAMLTADAAEGGLKERALAPGDAVKEGMKELALVPADPVEGGLEGHLKERSLTVSCGGHYAHSCASCPQGNGAAWCNGECFWLAHENRCVGLHEIPVLPAACTSRWDFAGNFEHNGGYVSGSFYIQESTRTVSNVQAYVSAADVNGVHYPAMWYTMGSVSDVGGGGGTIKLSVPHSQRVLLVQPSGGVTSALTRAGGYIGGGGLEIFKPTYIGDPYNKDLRLLATLAFYSTGCN